MTEVASDTRVARRASATRRFVWLRWLLVAPVGVVAFIGALLLSLLLHGIPELLCPRDELVSGMCMATWADAGHTAALALGGAVGAALVVGLPAAMAPRWRSAVALLAFGHGFWFVLRLVSTGTSFHVPFIAATSSGLAVLVLVHVKTLAR